MEKILFIIWFVGLVGSIVLSIIAITWSGGKRDDAHFKVMGSHSLEEWHHYRIEWDKWARITMNLLRSAMVLSIISLIAIVSTIFV